MEVYGYIDSLGARMERRNARNFKEKEIEMMDILEKAEFLASPWALTEKAFKGFSFSLIILN